MYIRERERAVSLCLCISVLTKDARRTRVLFPEERIGPTCAFYKLLRQRYNTRLLASPLNADVQGAPVRNNAYSPTG